MPGYAVRGDCSLNAAKNAAHKDRGLAQREILAPKPKNAEQRKTGPQTLLILRAITHAAKRSALPHGPSSPPKVLLWTNQAAELGSYAQPKNDGEQ